jgi:hypothetical protein
MMFDYAHGRYLMAKTTLSPDVVDYDDKCTPGAEIQPPKARQRWTIPTKQMDRGKGPKRAIARPLGIQPSINKQYRILL